jgi:hypothetical protein
MQRRQRPEPGDEPAVTFELEEAPRGSARDRLGAAGAAAVAGAGLISGGASPEPFDTLDVFDDLPADPDVTAPDAGIPVTSFADLSETASNPAFPPIDFGTSELASAAQDLLHGATGEVGGGFTLASAADAGEVFAPDPELAPLEPLAGDLHADDDLDDLDLDDFDLS